MTASTTDANASVISTAPMSPTAMPRSVTAGRAAVGGPRAPGRARAGPGRPRRPRRRRSAGTAVRPRWRPARWSPRPRRRRRRCRRSCRPSRCRRRRTTGRQPGQPCRVEPGRGRSSVRCSLHRNDFRDRTCRPVGRRRSARGTAPRTRPAAAGRCPDCRARASAASPISGSGKPAGANGARVYRTGAAVATGGQNRQGAVLADSAPPASTSSASPAADPGRGLQHRVQPGPALPVDGHPGHRFAKPGGQGGDPGDVPARAEAVAEDDVVDRQTERCDLSTRRRRVPARPAR